MHHFTEQHLVDHLAWLRSEIDRLTILVRDLRNEFRLGGGTDMPLLSRCWAVCGAAGGMVASWNHLTGERLSVEDVAAALGIPAEGR